MNTKAVLKTSAITLALGGGLALPSLPFAADEKAPAPKTQTVKGEIVDLMCYLDHLAKGEKHKGCAEKCIKVGGPCRFAQRQPALPRDRRPPADQRPTRPQSRPDCYS